MVSSLAGRALVVGGAGGIGAACADRLREDGHEVLVMDRSLGHDAADHASVSAVLSETDYLAVVVHAAGSVGQGGIADLDLSEWRRVLDDNLTSAAVVAHHALPLMKTGGSMVLFSSVNGRHGGNELSGPAYAAAKAGLIGLTRHLAKHQAARGVRVNCVAPGPVDTPMLDRLESGQLQSLVDSMPLGRLTTREEIAGTVSWLCSTAASSVTGAVIDLNGGLWMG